MLFEAGVKILLFICLISSFQTLLGGSGLVGGGVSINNTHVMNTIRHLHPEVSYE